MSRLTRALDKSRIEADVTLPRPPQLRPVPQPVKRALSVQRALEWAFAVECAQIEFDEVNPDAYTVGSDPIWRMMRQAEIGCRVDGGGVSRSADDAEVIASVVACLPPGQGGKGMAVRIASLARAGLSPDPMVGAAPKVVPVGRFTNRHGCTAKTEVVGKVDTIYRGRKVTHDVLVCPVTYSPDASEIAAARRDYLDWWGALLHLRYELGACGLASIEITDTMPAMTPWR